MSSSVPVDTPALLPTSDERGAHALDRIEINGIAATGHHGVLPDERLNGQRFVVDVTCGVLRADRDDVLASTVDYSALAVAIVADIEREPVNLIETLAERVAVTCLARPMVQRVSVRVHKPQAPIPVPFTDVTVEIERRRPRTRAVLSMGSNLDDPLAHLAGGVSQLRRAFGIDVVAVSPVYRTDPVGVRNQPDFLNIVVLLDTVLSPQALLSTCHDVEREHERRRETLNGPRTLDIDIVSFGDLTLDEAGTHPSAPARPRSGLRPDPLARRRPRGRDPGRGGRPRPRGGPRAPGCAPDRLAGRHGRHAVTSRRPLPPPRGPEPPPTHLRPTSWRTVLVGVVVGAVAGYVVVSGIQLAGDTVPITPWSLSGMLATFAVGGWVYSRHLARRLRDQRGSITPEEGVRALVLGKVMVLGGAVLAGWHVAYVLRYLARLGVPAPQERVIHGAVTVVFSAAFALAGWLLERACIVPPGDDDESGDES